MSNQPGIFPRSHEDEADLARWFPKDEPELTPLQRSAKALVSGCAYGFSMMILRCLPRCADRTAAIRKVREATETAFAGIRAERGAYVDREKR